MHPSDGADSKSPIDVEGALDFIDLVLTKKCF